MQFEHMKTWVIPYHRAFSPREDKFTNNNDYWLADRTTSIEHNLFNGYILWHQSRFSMMQGWGPINLFPKLQIQISHFQSITNTNTLFLYNPNTLSERNQIQIRIWPQTWHGGCLWRLFARASTTIMMAQAGRRISGVPQRNVKFSQFRCTYRQ